MGDRQTSWHRGHRPMRIAVRDHRIRHHADSKVSAGDRVGIAWESCGHFEHCHGPPKATPQPERLSTRTSTPGVTNLSWREREVWAHKHDAPERDCRVSSPGPVGK